MEGVSMLYSFNDGDAKDRTPSSTSRCSATAASTTTVDGGDPPLHPLGAGGGIDPFNDDVWELYDTNTDWTQAHDLAAEMPEKLAELQRQFLIEATAVRPAAG